MAAIKSRTIIAVADKKAKEWLTQHINWEKAPRPLTLKNFLPLSFDNYISILWTPGIIDNFPFDKIIQPSETIEQTNINVAIWQQFRIFLEEDDEREELYRSTTFAELTSLFHKANTLVGINSLPWETRGIKTLFKRTEQKLEKIISALSADNDLNLYIEDYYRWSELGILPVEEGLVYKVSVQEFVDVMNKTFYDASLYLYGQSKEWCLINLEDLEFNILAYNNRIADKVAELNLLDTFKLHPDDTLFE